MQCDRVRTALSARLDGESDGGFHVIDAHLVQCGDCRRWLISAERVTRVVREPAPAPDLTERILAGVHRERLLGMPARSRSGTGALRVALGVLAVIQLVIAAPGLLGTVGHDAHAGREVSAFDMALSVGLLLVACYPDQARFFAPVVTTLVLCLVTISVLDVTQGVVSSGKVAIHALAVCQAMLVWMLARRHPLVTRTGSLGMMTR